jgi:hypothetical protein
MVMAIGFSDQRPAPRPAENGLKLGAAAGKSQIGLGGARVDG